MTADVSTGEVAVNAADPEPISRTILGVELVTIPLDHYAALLECRRLVAENDLRRRGQIGGASRIDRDPEVAAFLAEIFPTRSLKAAYALCVARFGEERAPSRSSVQRFRARLRGGR